MAVGTATAIAGVAAAAISTGVSVSQANKAAAQRRKAQQAAQKAMEEARRETEIMPGQELSLDLAAYEQAREAQNVAAATGIQAAQQAGSRELAAAVGRQQMANIQGQQQIRAAQAKEQMALDKYKAEERAKASDTRAELALGEAEAAQAAAADAAARKRQAEQSAIASGIEGIGQLADLYAAVQGDFDPSKLNPPSITPNIPSGVDGVQQAIQGSNLNSSQVPIQYTDPITGQVMLLDPRGLPIR